jgi:transcriptional regulator of acetoin/glycerol metabolism
MEVIVMEAALAPQHNAVARSWQRSRLCGLDESADLTMPYSPWSESENRFTKAALPVLDNLSAAMPASETALVLLDAAGRVLVRRSDDGELSRRMDRGSSAPGFVWTEEAAGATAVGVALEERIAALTVGSDHFLEALRDLACAAAPIVNPLTQKLEGVIDLTSLSRDGSPLMMPLVLQIAEMIKTRLVEGGSVAERALLDRFLRERRSEGQLVMVLGERTELTTASASALLAPSDRVLLAQRSIELLNKVDRATETVPLSNGHLVNVRFERVTADDDAVGTLLELQSATSGRQSRRSRSNSVRRRERSVSLPAVGRSQASQFLRMKAAQLSEQRFPVIITGESGVGKTSLARAMAAPEHDTVLIDLDQMTADAESSFMREIQSIVGAGGHCVVVRAIETLSDQGLTTLATLAETAEANNCRVICTMVSTDEDRSTREPSFGVRLHVPPLRERPEDLLELAPAVLAHRGLNVWITSPVMRALMRYEWPGNVRELDSVLCAMAASSRGSDITLQDLPAFYQRGNTRLRRIEQVERSAIAQALVEAGGNKTRAAKSLEIGRATLYRKMRLYGLDTNLLPV